MTSAPELHSPHAPLSFQQSAGDLEQELALTEAWWRAANYLAVGMIYLQDNPLLKEPLRSEHIKNGCWAIGAPAPARPSSGPMPTGRFATTTST